MVWNLESKVNPSLDKKGEKKIGYEKKINQKYNKSSFGVLFLFLEEKFRQ